MGIYIHIPFCHSKCAYCDFYSLASMRWSNRFVDALTKEYDMRKHELQNDTVNTLYLGGGTPSILPLPLLKKICYSLPKDHISEFTIEANPEDISLNACTEWRRLGINRVSMGVQSLCDQELHTIGRRHSAEDAIIAFDTLRKAGFDNISLDLIYGLPGQTLQSWHKSLSGLLDLRPEHLSAYILSYESGTLLTSMLQRGKITSASDDLILDMYALLCDETRNNGYEHYEISNFALSEKRAIHNSSYWSGSPYLGLGPGAHSFDGNLRRINPSNLSKYLLAIESGTTAFEIENEDDDNRFNDLLITRLRTKDGLSLNLIPEPRLKSFLHDAQRHIACGNIVCKNDYFIIPEEHWPVSDSIISDLMQI